VIGDAAQQHAPQERTRPAVFISEFLPTASGGHGADPTRPDHVARYARAPSSELGRS
jgi:hypothetical protein